jgi:endoglucanase
MKAVIHALLLTGMLWAKADDPAPPSPATTTTVQLEHGINLGNFLEAPHEGDWGYTLTERDFAVIKQAGFTTVRVPINWAAHVTADPAHTVDPAFFARIDWVVAQARKNGLNAILDYHNDLALMKDPATQGDRFVTTWQQVAAHYRDAPPSILFELLNEPGQQLDSATWNVLLRRALAVVRAGNPTRSVVVGPVQKNQPSCLPSLSLPQDDRGLIVTFHYYHPMHFTHQGARWIPGFTSFLGTKWMGTDAETAALARTFDQVAAWGKEHRRPIFLGEFGTFTRGDIDSRVRWTSAVARAAEARGFSWAYWEFCAGFGAYDPVAQKWKAPLLAALRPGGP